MGLLIFVLLLCYRSIRSRNQAAATIAILALMPLGVIAQEYEVAQGSSKPLLMPNLPSLAFKQRLNKQRKTY